ncbi:MULTISPECIES: c-type cytochrome [Rhodococcus]|jgi:mono/diheme cytochrome c family protein|uniref:Cytochrome c n=1 Tax=Rhodococcus qingshengii JCM 15477 TaxID=1303681 RepID=A0AB38RNM2_RHOSG|nr:MULTISPECIES: cytochrome c [Rhodococcus]UPU46923.1 cytochrome c [Rhodococcus qingshengii JCM 15477]
MSNAVRSALGICALAVSAGAAGQYGPMSSRQAPASAPAPVAASQPASAPGAAGDFDVEKLFANTCGWCHSSGGRSPGRGPQLMDTKLSDAELIQRIKVGKPGAMPAFATAFNDDQMKAIVKYIRDLKPEGASK